VRLVAFTGLALAAKWKVLGQAGLLTQTVDSEHFTLYEEAARRAVADFHQLPLWNPYYCGGISQLGTPSARFVSPTFLLTLLFGTLRADPLILMAMTVVGLEGAFRYVRTRGGGAMGAFLAAPIFALCGCFARWPTFAWINFYGFQLVPWVLYGAREAFRGSRRGAVVLALAVAWMIGFGGTYAAPLTALAVIWEGLSTLPRRSHGLRDLGRLLVIGVAAGVFAVSLSLVRLWPIAETLLASPRILGGSEGTKLPQIWKDLFGTEGGGLWDVWGAVRSYGAGPAKKADYLVGIAALPLFLAGGVRRRALAFLPSSIVWLWLALGYNTKHSLFGLLRAVPPFTMLRAPERALPMFVLGFAVLSALALRRAEVYSRKKPVAILLVYGCVFLFGVNLFTLIMNDSTVSGKRSMTPPPAVVDRPFHQTRGNRWMAFYYMEMNRGTLACFDDYNVAQSPNLRGDLLHEEYLGDPEAGTVTEKAWSPDRIDLDVDVTRPARVYVNGNWNRGWHASEGKLVNDRGLLAVDVPQGSHDVVLRFLPRSAIVGGLTSLAGLLVAIYIWRKTKERAAFGTGRALVREAGLFASPMLVAALGWAAIREPPLPPEPLVTPDGEAVVASAPPADATPVGARWLAEGITLEAVRFLKSPATNEDTYVTMELDWRLSKKPPPGLAISLRVEDTAKGVINFDYATFSETLLIEDAPIGKTIRDVRENLRLQKGEEPLKPRLLVRLYYGRRDGKPVLDVHGSGAPSPEGRIEVGSFTIP
jgi:hypothetical protein